MYALFGKPNATWADMLVGRATVVDHCSHKSCSAKGYVWSTVVVLCTALRSSGRIIRYNRYTLVPAGLNGLGEASSTDTAVLIPFPESPIPLTGTDFR